MYSILIKKLIIQSLLVQHSANYIMTRFILERVFNLHQANRSGKHFIALQSSLESQLILAQGTAGREVFLNVMANIYEYRFLKLDGILGFFFY